MMIEKVARAIADGLGDNFDHAFANKSEWNAERGNKGGRDRDINEPMQPDYIDAALAAIEAMREPDAKIIAKCRADWPTFNGVIFKDYWTRYLDAALSEAEG